MPQGERLARFKELAAAYSGNVSPLITRQHDLANVIFVPVLELDTADYHRGRILLIGDAAHAFSPVLAQGAAMAIEDAVTLAELIGSGDDIDMALRIYESRRRTAVTRSNRDVRHRAARCGPPWADSADRRHSRSVPKIGHRRNHCPRRFPARGSTPVSPTGLCRR